jgi:hypothetical protein
VARAAATLMAGAGDSRAAAWRVRIKRVHCLMGGSSAPPAWRSPAHITPVTVGGGLGRGCGGGEGGAADAVVAPHMVAAAA